MQVSNMLQDLLISHLNHQVHALQVMIKIVCLIILGRHFISIGCFYLNFKDAIKEGDGERIVECWHYLLPIFRNAGRKNYCFEAFNLLCQYYFDLPPLQAEQLLWCRFVNTYELMGRNISLDLYQECLSRLLKDIVEEFGSNNTEVAIVRSSKALGTLHNMLSQFNKDNLLGSTSELHPSPSYQREMTTIIKELKKYQVFGFIEGRKSKAFPKPRCILHLQPKKNIKKWVKFHVKKRYLK